MDRRVHVWRKADEIWRPECGGLRGGTRVAVMFRGCIIFDGVGTLTEIEGNMNTTKYLETLGDNVRRTVLVETGRGSLSFTMFVKSLKVPLLLTFTERKITRSPRSVTNFFLPVLGLFSTEFLSS
jgi:hypothetical protein